MKHDRIRVVAAVIRDGERYLLTQRREAAAQPLLWEFPGGRVEPGEEDADALRRELDERLGVAIDVGGPVAYRSHDYGGYHVELLLYEATITRGDPEPRGVRRFEWVAAEDFPRYPFPAADRETLDDVQLLGLPGKGKKPPSA